MERARIPSNSEEETREGTCWEETDEEESEHMVNVALMENSSEEASSSSTQVPSLVLLDMTFGECKKTIEDMSAKMFNLHTSLSTIHEEIVGLIVRMRP